MKCRRCPDEAAVIVVYGPDAERISAPACPDHMGGFAREPRSELFVIPRALREPSRP